ncbi:MAG: hypothetical protein G01um101470_1104 [Parcubacteria group bacterium Gr01-1014_70]|nr:MAG: hypothetical protein G01um101470_1104 [Parcubacteria group bacterium Gr01-1014_70]
MQKGFGLMAILVLVGIIAVLGFGALKMGFPTQNPFTPTDEEKSAIDMAEQAKDMMEGKNNEMMPIGDDETKDWNIYRNEKYGFEFKYPNGRMLESLEDDFDVKIKRVFNKGVFGKESTEKFVLSIYENNDSLEVKDWYEGSVTFGGRKVFTLMPRWATNFTAPVESMLYSEAEDQEGVLVFYLWAGRKKLIYGFIGHSTEENLKILSTFKFTN